MIIPKMRKHRLYLLLLVLGLSVGALVIALIASGEPAYDGRSLSEWVDIYQDPARLSLSRESVDDAMEHFGTNALPYLLKWIQYEPTPLKARTKDVANGVLGIFKSHWELGRAQELRADGAALAFAALGRKAESMVGELNRLLDTCDDTARRATRALGGIGKAGFAVLEARLRDPGATRRVDVGYWIGDLGTNARPLLPVLIECLEDKDAKMASAAANALRVFRFEPSLVVPPLTTSLRHTNHNVRFAAALSVQHFGKAAGAAVPALLDLLRDSDLAMRLIATNALLAIDPQALKRTTAQ